MLTPTKKGLIGSISLNEHLQKTFNPPSEEKDELKFGSTVFRVGDRVMQNKNDYQIEYKAAGNEKAPGKGVLTVKSELLRWSIKK